MSSDAISNRIRKSLAVGYYVPRIRHEHEALPAKFDLFERSLYKGEDLKPYAGRPGALDAFKLPSKGMA